MYFSLINIVFLTVGVLAQMFVLFMSIGISKGDKNNLTEFSSRKCVLGFREIEGKCKECIGFYGIHCGHPCIHGFFGEGCRSSCNCSAGQTCNQFVGCIPPVEVATDRGFEAESNTPPGGDWDCLHWPLMVGFIGFQILLGLVGYWFRRSMKWRRNLEIPGTETEGQRRLITCKKTTENKNNGKGRRKACQLR